MGVLGGPGAVLVKPWGLPGHYWGAPGGPWKVLWGLLGRPCGRPSASDATHTHVSAFRMFSCVSFFFCFCDIVLFCFVFVLAMGVWELFLGSLAGPQGILEGFWGSLGGPRKFLGGSG